MYALLITFAQKNNMKILAILTIFIISSTFVFGEFPIGEVPPAIVLEGDLGGKVGWNTLEQ